nr:Fic family protein [Propionibacterium sp.]
MEVKGYGDAASWVYREAMGAGDRTADTLITVQEIRHIHHLALTLVWQVSPHREASDAEAPGNFRRHDIHPFAEGMTPPSWPLVPAALDEWVTTISTIPARLEAGGNLPELLAEAHNHFERVHPFLDGNGRAGRLALNLVLVRLGYPPVVILKEQRAAYLRAMQQADKGDVGPLGEILARAMIDNLNRFIIPNVAGPAKLVPLAALVDSDDCGGSGSPGWRAARTARRTSRSGPGTAPRAPALGGHCRRPTPRRPSRRPATPR